MTILVELTGPNNNEVNLVMIKLYLNRDSLIAIKLNCNLKQVVHLDVTVKEMIQK